MLTDTQLERFDRQIKLPEVGIIGQQKLNQAKVLIVGLGGLGSPVAMYLAAAGVGTLGLVDNDKIELSNLQRQIIHTTDTIGNTKVKSAETRLKSINPNLCIKTFQLQLSANNAKIIQDFDYIVDCCDNYPTRYLLNQVCLTEKKTWVHSALQQHTGQLAVFDGRHACYRCIFPLIPSENKDPNNGVIGSLAGIMGSMQANEVLKLIVGYGSHLTNQLLIFQSLTNQLKIVNLIKDPHCPSCSVISAR